MHIGKGHQLDLLQDHDEMATHKPTAEASAWYKRPAYSSNGPSRYMQDDDNDTVLSYLRKKGIVNGRKKHLPK